jgi:hypothetical protein
MARCKRQHATASSTFRPEAAFKHELEVFRTEAESAAQFFCAFLAIYAAAAAKKPVLNLVNTAPLFWKTTLGRAVPCPIFFLRISYGRSSRP